ncbi:FMN-dependent NADH-azoreductase [Gallibacterium trehalosifermentans]|uniref:FMN dependent NADH:quinone oxidoreductase n=1 Tax=Gallibacterium trehalosifermentans TaxID=516935 RepID=A0ABV6H155_9PAST
MSNVFVLRTSVNGQNSFSNQLIDQFIAKTKAKWSEVQIVERDLEVNPVPLLNSETVAALRAGVTDTEAQRNAIALSEQLIAELRNADYIVLGLPRYNFTTPATFRTYIDYIARPRVTFQYDENGPKGLLPNVPVFAFVTSGGEYVGTEFDTLSPWVKQTLGFVGLSNVEFIYAEGLAYKAEDAISAASARIDEILK